MKTTFKTFLLELVQTNLRDRRVSDHPNIKDLEKARNDGIYDPETGAPKPGHGSYGKAQPSKREPQMFTKHNFIPVANLDMNDGYTYYIKSLVDAKLMGSNPFFPQVYDILTLTDDWGESRYRMTVEKLKHGASFPPNMLIQLAERLFGDSIYESAGGVTALTEDSSSSEIEAMIAYRLNAGPIVDPALADAMEFIRKLAKNNKGVRLDLHSENFMFRRTHIGAQLVLSDPFANGTAEVSK